MTIATQKSYAEAVGEYELRRRKYASRFSCLLIEHDDGGFACRDRWLGDPVAIRESPGNTWNHIGFQIGERVRRGNGLSREV